MKSERTKNLSVAPWKAEEWIHGKGVFVVRNNKGYLVAENMSEQDANLIAAAPEMYDFINCFLTVGGQSVLRLLPCDIAKKIFDEADQITRKARGESEVLE